MSPDAVPTEALTAVGTPLGAGEELGGYVIEELAGRGGMGLVYRARDVELGRRVALKVIAPAVAGDPAFRRRFEREWRLAAALEHPHVVPVYRAGEDRGQLFLAMRLIEGASLEARLRADGAMEPEPAVAVIEQVARALDAAHLHGLVHRDVKPANILLDAQGEWAYLTDFGISVPQSGRQTLTGEARFLGTAAYAAPEQIRGGQVDARTDIYALGGVLHRCLTGEQPFPAEHPLDALAAHMLHPPPQPSARSAGIPSAFDEVVGRAMSKERAARFPTAGHLARAARSALGGQGRGPRPPAPVVAVSLPALPVPSAPLVGRVQELADLRALLARNHPRLVTLAGPGGTGKTRLALELALGAQRSFRDGAVLVELASLTDPDLVVVAIAQALGLREPPERSLAAGLDEFLRDRELLLLLDNFEHVISAAPVVADLLHAAPALKVIVTSREPLRLQGEQEYAVPPLGVPGEAAGLAELADSDAVALFVARVVAVRRDFQLSEESAPVVAEICTRLDGLPLAIELAAARARVLPLPALLTRLERALDILTGGSREHPERQRTLRSALDWSHDLLTPPEQALFGRLAVFAGSWSLAQAEAICDPAGDLGIPVLDGLGSLVEKSLIREELSTAEPGFRMLHTVREYARGRLEHDPGGAGVQRAHAEHFADVAENAGWFTEEVTLVERLGPVQDDLRGALAWAREAGDDALALRLAAQTASLYIAQGVLNEAEILLDQAIAELPDADAGLASLNLTNRAYIHNLRLEPERALAVLDLARDMADRSDAPEQWLAEIHNAVGVVAKDSGDLQGSIAAFTESARLFDLVDPKEAAFVRLNLANAHVLAADPEASLAVCAAARAQMGRFADADEAFLCLVEARGALARDQPAAARAQLHRALEWLSTMHEAEAGVEYTRVWPWTLAECLDEVARAVAEQGEAVAAGRLWGAAGALREQLAAPRSPALRALHVEAIARAAGELDGDAFAAAWAEGQTMDRVTALADALAVSSGPPTS